MCTVVISHDPQQEWPLLLAANRDERLDRPWLPPARHWADQPDVIGGQDEVAGGSWLTLNDAGVVAGIMNRVGSLGPAPGKNSRGALPLMAGRFSTAREAVAHIGQIDAGAWRSFNMIVADRTDAFFIRGPGYGQPQVEGLEPGVHMVATTDPDDMAMPRIHRHLPRFRAAARPVPPEWTQWTTLLADRSLPAGSEINIPPAFGFWHMQFIGHWCGGGQPQVMVFAAGAPDRVGYSPVDLDASGAQAR